METPVESELVTAAQAGDERALELLLQEYLPLIYNVVGRALNGHADVDDVVQETMLRVAQALPGLREPDRFRSWLIAITIRQIQERGRSRARRSSRESSLEQLGERPDPTLDFVDATVLELGLAGQRQEVAEATRWLSEDDQNLLALWWQEVAGTITRADLAAAAGLTPQHAAVRVQRMKAHLETARVVQRAASSPDGCPRLRALLGAAGARSGPRPLARFTRHVRRCDRCAQAGDTLVPPESLLAGIALLPVPVGLVNLVPDLLQRVPDLFGGLAGGLGAGHTGLAGGAAVTQPALALKPTLLAGTALAGAAAAISLTVHYLPPGEVTPPPSPAPSSRVVASPTTAASPSATAAATPAPTARVAGVTRADWYVAPDGDDGGSGAIDDPFGSLAKAVSVVRPGQTIALRGGRYRPPAAVRIETDGTAERPIVLSNYRDERPVIDGSAVTGTTMITQTADHWTVQGLEITRARTAYACDGCRGGTFRRLAVHDNQGFGLKFGAAGTVGNRVLDSDFFNNHDDAEGGADADGLIFYQGSGAGNVVRGCRFFHNADDGMSVVEFDGAVTVDSSWAFGNGINRWGLDDFGGVGYGFRLEADGRPVDHVVTNSAAWDNARYGFGVTSGGGSAQLIGNTAFRNGRDGFQVTDGRPVLTRNLSLDNRWEPARLAEDAVERGNSWGLDGWDSGRLRSTDPASAEGPRPEDGRLPVTSFLVPRTGDGAPGASMRPARSD